MVSFAVFSRALVSLNWAKALAKGSFLPPVLLLSSLVPPSSAFDTLVLLVLLFLPPALAAVGKAAAAFFDRVVGLPFIVVLAFFGGGPGVPKSVAPSSAIPSCKLSFNLLSLVLPVFLLAV